MKIETELLDILTKSRYVRNFIRDKQLIVSVILICFAWSLIYLLLFYKPGYESIAKVWIKNLATEEFVASLDTQSQLTPLTTAGNPLLTQMEILGSNQLKQAVVDYKLLQGEKISLSNVDIEVKNKPNTDVLNIEYKDTTPEDAQDTLNLILSEYERINLSISKKVRTTRREYIDIKLADIEKKLHDVRTQIKEYKTKTLAIDLVEQSKQLVDQNSIMSLKLEDTLAEITNTRSSIWESEKQLSLKPKEAINAVALGSGNENLVELRKSLNEAVQQYEFDSAKYADTNPLMIAQKNKINTINKQIKRQVELSIGQYAKSQKINIFDPVREQIVTALADNQTKLMGLQAQEKSIRSSIQRNNLVQSKIPEQKLNLDNLEQEERALSEAYDQLKEKQIEAKIKEAEAVSNIIVVDYPSLPKKPSFPTVFQSIILGLMLGLFAGVFISILKTYLEDVCDDVESIEEITSTSVAGIIPWLDDTVSEEQIKLVQGLAYDSIVSNLLIKCYKDNIKALTFTSSSLKKTQPTIIYQIATRLRKSGHSVVIIDSDFRIPTTIKSVGLEDKVTTNLSELIVTLEGKIQQKQELVSNREITNTIVEDEQGICYIGNKDSVFAPYELYGTKAFAYIIDTLKRKYDWVLVDTGVAHITPEFLIISKLSDGVVLFVNKTITYTTLRTITKQLKNAGIPFVGTIVRESGSRLKTEYTKYLDYLRNKLTDSEEKTIEG